MSAAGAPPGSFTFFFFLASRPCLSRPLPMATSFYHKRQLAQEGFDIGDEADRLPAATVGELGHHRRVDVNANGAHTRWEHVAGGDRVQHRRHHQAEADAANLFAHLPLRFQDVGIYQVQIARRQDAVPLTRDYIAERVLDLRMREALLAAEADAATVEALPRRAHRN